MLTLIPLLIALQEPAKSATPARGLVKNSADAFAGYTLVAPLQSTDTVLVDMQGTVVQRWKSDAPPGQAV